MKLDYGRTARFMRRQFVRHAWTTTQQKWTTSFIFTGLLIATIAVPPLGIAVFGTAFAGWWLTVFLMTLFFGLVGNRVGIGRERAALLRETQRSDPTSRA